MGRKSRNFLGLCDNESVRVNRNIKQNIEEVSLTNTETSSIEGERANSVMRETCYNFGENEKSHGRLSFHFDVELTQCMKAKS